MDNNSAYRSHGMATAVTKLEEAAAAIDKLRSQLLTSEGNLMGQWRGPSAVAFKHTFAVFDTEFVNIQKDLDTIHERLTHTHMKYVTAEQAKSDVAKKVEARFHIQL